MKLISLSILALAAVILVIGWRATTHHPARTPSHGYIVGGH